MVDRALDDGQVAGVVGVAERPPGDLVQVVHVAVRVDDHDQLGQRHHVGAPDGVHHLLRVLGVLLVDRDDRAVVEAARLGQVVVHDVRDDDLQQRQEEPLGGPAQRAVLGRRPADDDRLEQRPLAHRHAVDGQRREGLLRGVEAGVVAERALGQHLAGLQPALQHDLGVRGHLERHGLAVDHLDPLALRGIRRTGTRRCRRAAGRWRRTSRRAGSRRRSRPAAARRACAATW